VLLLAGAWRRFVADQSPINGPLLATAAVVALLAGIAPSLLRRRTLAQVAEQVDEIGATKDRLVTALALHDGNGRLDTLARHECEAYLASRNLQPLIPLHPPRAGAWLVVPLVALGLLQLDFQGQREIRLAEAAKAQQSIGETVRQVEQLALQTRAASEQAKSDELKKLAEELQRSAERLRTETKSEDAQKAALRELSSLEEMMRELQRQPSPPDEAKELAKALSTLPGMQDVLNALNQDDLAAAEEAMDRALKEQKENRPDQLTEEQVEKNLREAMQGLADRRRLSEALQKLADQMKQKGGEGASHSAMQQLAKMLQQMRTQGQQASGSGSQQQQMTLQELIAALENMKFGDGDSQSNQASNDQTPGGGKIVTMQSFGSANPQGSPQPGDANLPSGRPGSEHDFGTTDTPFGGKNDPQEKGGELAVKGQLSEGESLSMMLPSAGDKSKSARRYKELYEAAAGAAENAVEQENIPLGSRFLIKRYFESIRPRE
jgi:hypothetical protein